MVKAHESDKHKTVLPTLVKFTAVKSFIIKSLSVLYYKTLWIRSLQTKDISRIELVPFLVSIAFIREDKHTSLLQNPYIMNL